MGGSVSAPTFDTTTIPTSTLPPVSSSQEIYRIATHLRGIKCGITFVGSPWQSSVSDRTAGVGKQREIFDTTIKPGVLEMIGVLQHTFYKRHTR